MLHEGVVVDYLGPDKALFKVGVYLACGLRRLGAPGDGPCPDLLGAGGKVAYEAKEGVAFLHQLIKAAFANAHLGEEVLLFLGGELGYLLFDAGADGECACLFGGGGLVEGVYGGQILAYFILGDVCNIDDGLVGDGIFPFLNALWTAYGQQKQNPIRCMLYRTPTVNHCPMRSFSASGSM